MNFATLEPDHIEDYLVQLHVGPWFLWADSKNKVYDNLVVVDGYEKPTEQECIDGLKAMIDNYKATQYKRDRELEYPPYGVQLDYIYHNGIDKWKTDIVDPVKKKYPKPE